MNPSKLMIVGLGVATGVVAPRACEWVGNNRRIRRTIHVAMGRPIAYKIRVDAGQVSVNLSDTLIEDCEITTAPPAIEVDTLRNAVDDLIAKIKARPAVKVQGDRTAVRDVTVMTSTVTGSGNQ